MFKRQSLMEALASKRGNGRVKIITGLRRSGKSFLLKEIYIPFLLKEGVRKENVILLELDDLRNAPLRNPIKLVGKILSSIEKGSLNHVFVDEIQLSRDIENPDAPGDVITFVDACNSLIKHPEIDLYVTGSNSRMLSSDILTRFRDRGDEIHVGPLTFSEMLEEKEGSVDALWNDYLLYGGLPMAVNEKTPRGKADYLTTVLHETYLHDILERNAFPSEQGLSSLGRLLATTTGSLNSVEKIANTLSSAYKEKFQWAKVKGFIEAFKDSFLIEEVERYDLVGRRNIESPHKFYFTDNGLMNAFSEFSHFEPQQALECTLYNHLRAAGYRVEVGAVGIRKMENGIRTMHTREIDFIASKYLSKLYIQVVLSLRDIDKENQEKASLKAIHDSNAKLVLVGEPISPYLDQEGILTMSVTDFLKKGCCI